MHDNCCERALRATGEDGPTFLLCERNHTQSGASCAVYVQWTGAQCMCSTYLFCSKLYESVSSWEDGRATVAAVPMARLLSHPRLHTNLNG